MKIINTLRNFISGTREAEIPIPVFITMLMEEYIQEYQTNLNLPSISDDYSDLIAESKKLSKLGLENTKNARIIREKLNSIKESRRSNEDARRLIQFVKDLRFHFGESTLLVGSEQFEKVLNKYKLQRGLLSDYTGIIPSKNVTEIEHAINRINSFPYHINEAPDNSYMWKITDCINETTSSTGESIFNTLIKWLSSRKNVVAVNTDMYHHDHCIWLEDLLDVNPDMPHKVMTYECTSLIKLKGTRIDSKTMFIACPQNQLESQPINITKRAVDPIVFQYSPYGIIIHSMWGEESEDKIFEEYKKINNLLSI